MWSGMTEQLRSAAWEGVRLHGMYDPCTAVLRVLRWRGMPGAAHMPYAVTMSTIAGGWASPMGLELEQVFDNLDAAVAPERQQQRLQCRLLGEGRERTLAVVADAL